MGDKNKYSVGKTTYRNIYTQVDSEHDAEMVILGLSLLDPEGVNRGDYFIDPPAALGEV